VTDPIATLVIRPQTALDAYSRTSTGDAGGGDANGFSSVMQRALQTTVAIRDKMVQAYQTIMNMTI